MTEEERVEITRLIKVSTEEAITETFRVMGIDVNDFDHIKEFRDNHDWVKKYRRTSEMVGSRIIVTITTIITGGIIATLWAFIQSRTD